MYLHVALSKLTFTMEQEILLSRICSGNHAVYISVAWLIGYLLRLTYLLYLTLCNGVNVNLRLCFMTDGKNHYFCCTFRYPVLWGKLEHACALVHLKTIKMTGTVMYSCSTIFRYSKVLKLVSQWIVATFIAIAAEKADHTQPWAIAGRWFNHSIFCNTEITNLPGVICYHIVCSPCNLKAKLM